jgi:hypothetical protein
LIVLARRRRRRRRSGRADKVVSDLADQRGSLRPILEVVPLNYRSQYIIS